MFDARELMANPETSPLAPIRTGLGLLIAFGLLFSAWATFVPLYSAVQAPGTVIVDSRRKTVQHLEGGIVREILVREGDRVKAGQALLNLADQQAKATFELFTTQIDAELAAEARLSAEKSGLTTLSFPPELTSRATLPHVAEVLQSESRLFEARLDAFRSQIQIYDDQKQQIREETKGYLSQKEENGRELVAIGEQLDSHRKLLAQGYATRNTVLELERRRAEKAGLKAQIVSGVARDGERLKEIESKIVALRSARLQEAADESKKSRNHRLELEDRIKSARDILTRLVVRSPIDGVVADLKVTTVGGVISGREALMDIVPQDDRLIVQAQVAVDDITEVTMGQKAAITLTAYKSSATPPVEGSVTYIGADRLTVRHAAGEIPYYPVSIAIDPASLKQGGFAKLQPGMGAFVQLQGRPRTAADYLFSPLLRRYRKAFRES